MKKTISSLSMLSVSLCLLVACRFAIAANEPTPAATVTVAPPDDSPPISEEEIRRELLKLEEQRILEKLRLDKPPEVNVSFHDLPAPVTKRLREHPVGDDYDTSEPLDDSPGQLKSVYIVGERPRRGRGRSQSCADGSGRPAICIEFDISARQLAHQLITNAILWLSVHFGHRDDATKHRSAVSANFSVAARRDGEEETVIGVAEAQTNKSGHWVSVNVTDYIRSQLSGGGHELGSTGSHGQLTLVVVCRDGDCAAETPPIAFSKTGSHRPFLELQTRRRFVEQSDNRRKRSKLCGPGSNSETECCLETLFVNFTEIGWHTWILQPRGYVTGYCKGRCQSTATRNYNAIMKAVLLRRRSEQQQNQQQQSNLVAGPPVDPEMAPCCSPLRMEPLEILYAKIENHHEQLSTAVLSAMIVDSCKC